VANATPYNLNKNEVTIVQETKQQNKFNRTGKSWACAQFLFSHIQLSLEHQVLE
jgi:hypothetical protein